MATEIKQHHLHAVDHGTVRQDLLECLGKK